MRVALPARVCIPQQSASTQPVAFLFFLCYLYRWMGSCSITSTLTIVLAAPRWWVGFVPTWCQTFWESLCQLAHSRPSQAMLGTSCSKSLSTKGIKSNPQKRIPEEHLEMGAMSWNTYPRQTQKDRARFWEIRQVRWRTEKYHSTMVRIPLQVRMESQVSAYGNQEEGNQF